MRWRCSGRRMGRRRFEAFPPSCITLEVRWAGTEQIAAGNSGREERRTFAAKLPQSARATKRTSNMIILLFAMCWPCPMRCAIHATPARRAQFICGESTNARVMSSGATAADSARSQKPSHGTWWDVIFPLRDHDSFTSILHLTSAHLLHPSGLPHVGCRRCHVRLLQIEDSCG